MTYSKSRVDRAGKLFVDFIRAVAAEKRTVPQSPEFEEAVQIIDWWRSEHAKPLSRVASNLRYYAAQHGEPVVAQRLKKFPSTVAKLLREPKMKLSRMGDIGGVRAVLPDQRAAYNVASRLRKNWTITRYSDYVAHPKPDGYRALHLIIRNRGQLIEVQLRTPNQHHWANGVEMFSRSMGQGLKFGGGPPRLQNFFKVLAGLYAREDQGLEPDLVLVEKLQDDLTWLDTLVEENFDES